MTDRPVGSGRRSQHSIDDDDQSDSYAKFHGMVHRRAIAVLRVDIARILDLASTDAPAFTPVKSIMGFIILFQVLSPCFCATYRNHWLHGTSAQSTMNVLSILCLIVPAANLVPHGRNFFYFALVLQTSFLLFTAIFARYLSATGRISRFVIVTIALYYATIGEWIVCVSASHLSDIFSEMV